MYQPQNILLKEGEKKKKNMEVIKLKALVLICLSILGTAVLGASSSEARHPLGIGDEYRMVYGRKYSRIPAAPYTRGCSKIQRCRSTPPASFG